MCVCHQHDMQQANTVCQSCEMTHAAQQQDVNSSSSSSSSSTVFKAPGSRTDIQHCNYRTQLYNRTRWSRPARGRLTLGRLVHADQCCDATVTVDLFLSMQGTPLLNTYLSVLKNNNFRTSHREEASVTATQMNDLSFNYQQRWQELWRLLRKPNALVAGSKSLLGSNKKSPTSQLMQVNLYNDCKTTASVCYQL